MRVALEALSGIPLIKPGDDLVALFLDALEEPPENGDVLVVSQKVVSKAEGRYVDLRSVTASARAIALADEVDKDPRLVELILAESTEVVRKRPGLLIVAHRLGMVLANAGIDRSNVPQQGGSERVLLLPLDPDRSADGMRTEIERRSGAKVGVLIIDSVGRAWRRGTVGIAIGASGVIALEDCRGRSDLFGRKLDTTQIGRADEIAAAASLLMGQAQEKRPMVLIRGLADPESSGAQDATHLVRPRDEDLFR
jgi:coenzyme F420-0:L-glutamate ligase/coenzyme F420-1:gamma-L-glutamate ligase